LGSDRRRRARPKGRTDAERGLNLRKRGKIRLACGEGEIGIRDEAPGFVDDVRLALVAELDLGHDLPDVGEVQFRRDDARPGRRLSAGNRHVGDERAANLLEVDAPEARPGTRCVA